MIACILYKCIHFKHFRILSLSIGKNVLRHFVFCRMQTFEGSYMHNVFLAHRFKLDNDGKETQKRQTATDKALFCFLYYLPM